MEEPPKPPPDPAEELLREWPELSAFGVDWVRKWLDLKDRLIEIAKVMRRFPWMVEVVRQRPMSILHPYTVEVYAAVDGSEACLSLTPPKAYCAQNGAVKEVKLELEFKRYETYKDKDQRGVPPQGAVSIHHGGERIREGTLAAPVSKNRRLLCDGLRKLFTSPATCVNFLNSGNTRNSRRAARGWTDSSWEAGLW
jgi:hypothetical protein